MDEGNDSDNNKKQGNNNRCKTSMILYFLRMSNYIYIYIFSVLQTSLHSTESSVTIRGWLLFLFYRRLEEGNQHLPQMEPTT